MNNEMLRDDLVILDMDAKNYEDFFNQLTKKLIKMDLVTEGYAEALIKRENEYPTALPTEPYAVAIPHADPVYINKQFIAPIRLKNSIKWCEMATDDVWHDVRLIFLLGFKHEEGHIKVLQTLVNNFQESELMEKLMTTEDEAEFLELIRSMN
jgi:PTS system galactitol-specific IIA component